MEPFVAEDLKGLKFCRTYFRPVVGKLQPADQIQSTTCFFTAHELRKVFRYLSDYKPKKNNTSWYEQKQKKE